MIELLIKHAKEIAKAVGAKRIVLLTDEYVNPESIDDNEVKVVLSAEKYVNAVKNTISMADSSGFFEKVLATPGISEFLTNYLQIIGEFGKSVLVVSVGTLKGIIVLDAESKFERVLKECSKYVDPEVLRAVIALAISIGAEGREGRKIGTAFIVGDTEEVLKRSRQIVLNPFEGHDESVRDIKNPENWETIKEFAQIDGVFIVDEKGVIVAAGRYLNVEGDVEIKSGLGGRHLAAASITKNTKAIAVVVSESGGNVTVWKDGKVILEIPVSMM